MKLLNINNFYSLITTERCNFSCSYCCASNRKDIALSVIESNIDAICDFFETVKPGLISLSGGEPALAKNIAILLKRLPQHKFAVFTNASLLPEWFFYDNLVLPIATYHAECIKEQVFIENVKRLFDNGKKVIVKIIVKPDEEVLPITLWERLWSIGIPAHFVPLDYDYYFYPDIINEISHKYLTSCLYNARFFRPEPGNISECFCMGGTIDMFEISSRGYIQRCSTVAITPPQKTTNPPMHKYTMTSTKHSNTILVKIISIQHLYLVHVMTAIVNGIIGHWRQEHTKMNAGLRICIPVYGKNQLMMNYSDLSTKCIGTEMVV